MSRYEVDKVCWQITHNDGHRDGFQADPSGFLAGRGLTDDERRGLIDRDYVALYRLGAHPMLLWIWLRRVQGARYDPGFNREYAAAVAPYGRPDFGT